MAKKVDMVHLQAKRSLWSGKVTALCGKTYQPGQYHGDGLFSRITGPDCPTCQRLAKKKGTR